MPASHGATGDGPVGADGAGEEVGGPGDPEDLPAHEDLPAEVTDLDPAAVATGSPDGTGEPGALQGDAGAHGALGEDALGLEDEIFVDGTVGRSDLAAERDEYLEALRRVKAEFENFRKRVERERLQMVDRAAEMIVTELLPVLDACDSAVAQGDEGVGQIRTKLREVLGKGGLEVIDSEEKPFDPNLHEAVLREEGDGEEIVTEVMRAGYTWRGRVLRPAMVKVRS